MAKKSVTTESNDDLVTPEEMAAQEFGRLLSDGDVDELEKAARSFGVNRRIGYAILSRSKAELLERAADPAEAVDVYLGMAEAITDYKEHLGNLLEQAEIAQVRALVMAATMAQRAEAA